MLEGSPRLMLPVLKAGTGNMAKASRRDRIAAELNLLGLKAEACSIRMSTGLDELLMHSDILLVFHVDDSKEADKQRPFPGLHRQVLHLKMVATKGCTVLL